MIEDVYNSTGVRLPQWTGFHLRYVAPAAIGFVVVLLIYSEWTSDSMKAYPRWAVFLFGVLPTVIALSAVGWPAAQFRLRRFFYTIVCPRLTQWTPEGLSPARLRAKKAGYKDWEDVEVSPPESEQQGI
mmetsp:Transcript_31676/g.73528  ORF Transcript_31676/g.73528 Transcript_31676/m.73528 type:complete len:129 (-) Transcript_31676:32-418(-)